MERIALACLRGARRFMSSTRRPRSYSKQDRRPLRSHHICVRPARSQRFTATRMKKYLPMLS